VAVILLPVEAFFVETIAPVVLRGTFQVPGDKSIGHRALLFSALCPGISTITNIPDNADVQATRQCLAQLGVQIVESVENGEPVLKVHTPGALQSPAAALDCQNSGTTIRLLSGLLAGKNMSATLTGDDSLARRPMGRVITPLRSMGATVAAKTEGDRLPVVVHSVCQPLSPLYYKVPVASAQVKSALILAALFAKGLSTLAEPIETRNHTEVMLRYLGVPIFWSQGLITVQGNPDAVFLPLQWVVPGDISSAAFMVVAATLIPGSHIVIENVGLNPTRLGLITALKQLKANITLTETGTANGEPVGTLEVVASPLSGDLTLTAAQIPSLIDELPILAMAALFNQGTLTVTGAEELRHKESDRIQSLSDELAKLGVTLTTTADGFTVYGQPQRSFLSPSVPLQAHNDHRLAMALTVLNVVADPSGWLQNPWPLVGKEWATVSYPAFYQQLTTLLTPVPSLSSAGIGKK